MEDHKYRTEIWNYWRDVENVYNVENSEGIQENRNTKNNQEYSQCCWGCHGKLQQLCAHESYRTIMNLFF